MAAGVDVMAKKKVKATKPANPKDESDERVAVIVLKGSPAYRAWLAEISQDSLIPITSIVRDALAKWAKEKGYTVPPKR